jgi:hypothetical protein
MEKDVYFLKQIAKIDENYPTTNQWREVVPLELVLNILKRYENGN